MSPEREFWTIRCLMEALLHPGSIQRSPGFSGRWARSFIPQCQHSILILLELYEITPRNIGKAAGARPGGTKALCVGGFLWGCSSLEVVIPFLGWI